MGKEKSGAEAGAEARKEAEAKKEAAAKAEAAKKKPPYYIAAGKSLTSKRGLLDSGDEVKLGDFGAKDPKAHLDELIKKGLVEKGG